MIEKLDMDKSETYNPRRLAEKINEVIEYLNYAERMDIEAAQNVISELDSKRPEDA